MIRISQMLIYTTEAPRLFKKATLREGKNSKDSKGDKSILKLRRGNGLGIDSGSNFTSIHLKKVIFCSLNQSSNSL